MTKPKKPAAIEIDPVRATVMEKRGQDGPRWYWRARTKGSRQAVWAGWGTREEASAIIRDRIAQGLPPSPRAARSRGSPRTLGDLADTFDAYNLRRVAIWEAGNEGGGLSPRTRNSYRDRMIWWKGALGELVLARLTRARVEEVCLEWLAAGVAARSVLHAKQVLSLALAFAEDRGWCRAPDLKRLSFKLDPEKYVNCDYTPEPHEVGAVLDGHPIGEDLPDAVRVMAWTGARAGEIECLLVGDVDLEAKTIRLTGASVERQRKGKSKVRFFPLGPELLAVLRPRIEGREPAEYVFALPPMLAVHINRWLANACEAAAVPRWTSHGMRRMFDTFSLDSGMSAKRIGKLTGQTPGTIQKTYNRPTAQSVRQELARVDIAGATRKPRGQVLNLPRAQNSGTLDDEAE